MMAVKEEESDEALLEFFTRHLSKPSSAQGQQMQIVPAEEDSHDCADSDVIQACDSDPYELAGDCTCDRCVALVQKISLCRHCSEGVRFKHVDNCPLTAFQFGRVRKWYGNQYSLYIRLLAHSDEQTSMTKDVHQRIMQKVVTESRLLSCQMQKQKYLDKKVAKQTATQDGRSFAQLLAPPVDAPINLDTDDEAGDGDLAAGSSAPPPSKEKLAKCKAKKLRRPKTGDKAKPDAGARKDELGDAEHHGRMRTKPPLPEIDNDLEEQAVPEHKPQAKRRRRKRQPTEKEVEAPQEAVIPPAPPWHLLPSHFFQCPVCGAKSARWELYFSHTQNREMGWAVCKKRTETGQWCSFKRWHPHNFTSGDLT